jgi:hypothetical protein
MMSAERVKKGACVTPGHEKYGPLCLACAMELAHEEADWTREHCAQIAEKIGMVGKHIAKEIRAGRPHEYEVPNHLAHRKTP